MENNIHQKLFLTAKGFFRIEPWQFLGNDDIFGLFLKEGALNSLKKVFLGENFIQQKGLPEEIRTDSKLLYDLLNQTLTALNIKMTYLEHLPKIKEIIKEMQELSSKTRF